jgi:hypothetical protein
MQRFARSRSATLSKGLCPALLLSENLLLVGIGFGFVLTDPGL